MHDQSDKESLMVSKHGLFSFLADVSVDLVSLGEQLERNLFDDPHASLAKARVFGEELAKLIAAKEGRTRLVSATQYERLKALAQQGAITEEMRSHFDFVRTEGNKAVHNPKYESIEQALRAHRILYELSVWFMKQYVNPSFMHEGYVHPRPSWPESVSLDRIEEILEKALEKKLKQVMSTDPGATGTMEQESAIAGQANPAENKDKVAEGMKWLAKAAEAGDVWSMAELAYRKLTGKQVKQDVVEGEKWLRKASQAGDSWSMMELGYRLLVGDGLRQDAVEGEMWLRRSTEAEYPEAMRILGYRLLEGDGLQRNEAEGKRWIQQAAEKEEPIAMRILGYRLLHGVGYERDQAQGEFWLRKAAEAGEVIAMREYGYALIEGKVMAQDIAAGERWLTKAAEAGDAEAGQWLKKKKGGLWNLFRL
ncbi:hypothetical protein C1X05_14390 [Laceyella sacchari]|uniref:TPR repeat n=1 Tax=Laceyella tengchongensis TaxID=574699 RepID=A0AA45WQ26_9BACL|nr:hypothetical protein C1X05_14390 [Laceyella sacchari]SMP23052.1 TPR repeat [Laceyella tengchongensis]